MFDWLKKKLPFSGNLLFRGSIQPRPEELEGLAQAGIRAEPGEADPDAHWTLDLTHPEWGEAQLVALRNLPRPPRELIEYQPYLTQAEIETALAGEATVTLYMESKVENVLRDRKRALRFLRAAMGADGLAAVDHLSMRVWSRAALDEELQHDADLDIESLFCVHAVTQEESGEVAWLHTHGLDRLGAFDFDILEPSRDLLGPGGPELMRGVAYAIVEGKVAPNTASWEMAFPGGEVRLVEVNAFNRQAEKRFLGLRDTEDPEHNRDRTVLCEPEPGGFVSRLLLGSGVRPSKFLSGKMPEELMFHFSKEATTLMAQRARQTFGFFRRIAAELEEFEVMPAVKLGYEVDGTSDGEKEHLWFEVQAFGENEIEATLMNQPFHIERMKQGERGKHPLEVLSDWTLFTPLGPVTPRSTHAWRAIRENKDKIREALKESKRKMEEEHPEV